MPIFTIPKMNPPPPPPTRTSMQGEEEQDREGELGRSASRGSGGVPHGGAFASPPSLNNNTSSGPRLSPRVNQLQQPASNTMMGAAFGASSGTSGFAMGGKENVHNQFWRNF